MAQIAFSFSEVSVQPTEELLNVALQHNLQTSLSCQQNLHSTVKISQLVTLSSTAVLDANVIQIPTFANFV